jgi:hypothetical protein
MIIQDQESLWDLHIADKVEQSKLDRTDLTTYIFRKEKVIKVMSRVLNNISIQDGLLIKKYSGDLITEYNKAYNLWDISKNYNFIAPEPISINHEDNTISYELIQYDESIRDIYIQCMKSKYQLPEESYLLEKTGEILGIIHTNLKLDTKHLWNIPEIYLPDQFNKSYDAEYFLKKYPCAFLHCDFCFTNVYCKKNKNDIQIIILDPSPNYQSTFYADTYGPVYIDIGRFLMHINGTINIKHYPFITWHHLKELKNLFISGYQKITRVNIDEKIANIFSYGEALNYYSIRFNNNKIITYLIMKLLYNKLKRNEIFNYEL